MNMLVVDDQKENRYLLQTIFEARGYQVLQALNGAEALDILKVERVDLIISDILMPVMDGFQLCRKVRADDKLCRIPLIFYTATYTGPQDEEFAMQIGADRFIRKPCEPTMLVDIVEQLMVSLPSHGLRVTAAEEKEETLQLYNKRLVRKLEQKKAQLEDEIEARREVELALRRSEKRLIEAQRLACMGDFIWDVESGAVTWSEALCDLLGYPTGEAPDYTGINANLHHPDDLETITRWLDISIASGREELTPLEYRVVRKDGESIFVRTVGKIIRRPGRGPQVFATVLDISEQKQAETSLRQSEEKYRRIFENVVVGIFQSTPEGRFLTVNPAFARMLGYDSAEELLQTISDITTQYYVDAEERWRYMKMLAEQKYVENFEFEVRRKDGTIMWVSNSTRAYFREDNTILYYEGIVIDVDRRKQAEKEQDKLQNRLIQAQKMESVGRLAGGVAHDFNNMLNVISGFTELALEKVAPDDPIHDDLLEVRNAARRSADITRQLLAFARKQTIRPQLLDLNETLESMLKLLRRLIGEDIELIWLPGRGVLPVKMDPAQLDQILANLCVNSRDAITDVGKITIKTSAVCLDEADCSDYNGCVPGDYVLLEISDNGCGMDSETLDKLFEPFFTTKEVDKGTGLGLATVYGIVKQNDGFIYVSSKEGVGTIFRIYLARLKDQIDAINVSSVVPVPKGQGETVLIVEDETSILRLTQRILNDLGYTVLTAASPAAAVELAAAHEGTLDLLITDVIMPEMNGHDLAEKLQADHPHIGILYISGYSADVIAHHGVLEEGVHFLQKPFSTWDIGVKVRRVLSDSRHSS
jgi:two-component system, cell cycle sensor histidine kinase and response regulator CckA